MNKGSRSKILAQVVVITIALALLSIGVAQKVIRVTTTTVVTLPGTTKITTISKPGTTEIMTVIHGGYRIIHIEMRPDQECVIVVEGEPVSVVTIPGASFPGTTAVYTIPKTVYETTITRVEGGTTRTTTGFDYVTVTNEVTMGAITMTMTIPAPIYGKITEYCKRITITIINRFEVSEPMTVKFMFPGFTFKGRVVTMPTLLVTGSVTATKTTTKLGTTYTTTIEKAGTTMVKTVTVPGTTMTKTITFPPKTITKKTIYTTTISGKPPTETVKPTKPPKPPKTKPKPTPSPTTTAAAEVFGGLSTFMLIAVAIAIVVVIAAVAVFLMKRPKTSPEKT